MVPASDLPSPVLITGVNGFIAGHLAERLRAQGVAVRGLARRPESASWLAPHGVEVWAGNLLDPAVLRQAAAGCGAIVHAAAWTGTAGVPADLAWRTNVEGTANILAAARETGVGRFVFVSSVAVYGFNRAPLIDESMPTPPVGQLYPDSKIAAEAAVRASAVPWVILRPASTYGPRGTAWTIGPVEHIRRGEMVLLGQDSGLVTPGYIENVVGGFVLALTHASALGQAFNVCDDKAVTYREFYLAYARLLGRTSLPSVPAWSARFARLAPARLLRRVLGKPAVGPWTLHFRLNPSQFGVAKARRVLGYAPAIDFDEGMRRTEVWLRSMGYL